MIHIGQSIKQEIQKQGKTTVWLAQQLGFNRTYVYKLYSYPSIDTQLLMAISRILNHDFFQELADEFEKEED